MFPTRGRAGLRPDSRCGENQYNFYRVGPIKIPYYFIRGFKTRVIIGFPPNLLAEIYLVSYDNNLPKSFFTLSP